MLDFLVLSAVHRCHSKYDYDNFMDIKETGVSLEYTKIYTTKVDS